MDGSSGDMRMMGSVQSREAMTAEAEAHVEECLRGRHGFWAMVNAMLRREAMVNDMVRDQMEMNAMMLMQGGDVRQAPPIAAVNYLSVDHPELYRSVHEGVDPGVVGEVGDAWVKAGEWMIGFQTEFDGAIRSSESEWRGAAGDAARTFMTDVGSHIGAAGSSAQLAGTQTGLHAQAVQDARDGMPEPVEFDLAAANRELQQITDPEKLEAKSAEIQASYDAQQRAHEQAAQVSGSFDQTMSGASTMPAFGAAPTLGGGDGGAVEPRRPDPGDRPPPDSGDRSRRGDEGVVPRGREPGDSAGPSGGQAVPGADPAGAPARAAGPVPSDGRWGGPPGETTPGGAAGETPGGTRVPAFGGMGTPGPVPGQVPVGFVPGFGPLGGGPGGAGGPGAGAGGPRAGTGGFGGGPGAGGGPGGGPGAGGGPGGGPRAGVGGPGAMAPGAAAAHAAAAGRGMGAGGGMPMGAGGGRREEDTEHERPDWLVEPDPEGLFGTDVLTAPPVIGVDE